MVKNPREIMVPRDILSCFSGNRRITILPAPAEKPIGGVAKVTTGFKERQIVFEEKRRQGKIPLITFDPPTPVKTLPEDVNPQRRIWPPPQIPYDGS